MLKSYIVQIICIFLIHAEKLIDNQQLSQYNAPILADGPAH